MKEPFSIREPPPQDGPVLESAKFINDAQNASLQTDAALVHRPTRIGIHTGPSLLSVGACSNCAIPLYADPAPVQKAAELRHLIVSVKLRYVVTYYARERASQGLFIPVGIAATVPQQVLPFPPQIQVQGVGMGRTKPRRGDSQ